MITLLKGCAMAPQNPESLPFYTNDTELIYDLTENISVPPAYLIEEQITDGIGMPINKLDEYNKIVSLSPAITELLVDLDYADKIVAITTYDLTNDIPETVVTLDSIHPDTGQLQALEPDLIISPIPIDDFDPMITTVAVMPPAKTIAEIYKSVAFVGELLDEQTKTQQLNDDMRHTIHNYIVAAADIKNKRTVYFETSPAPYMYAAGEYLSELVEFAGGINVIEAGSGVTDSMVASANPQVILTNSDYKDFPNIEIMHRNGWESVAAVNEFQVYQVESPLPNHNVANKMVEIARSIYPEYY